MTKAYWAPDHSETCLPRSMKPPVTNDRNIIASRTSQQVRTGDLGRMKAFGHVQVDPGLTCARSLWESYVHAGYSV